MDIIGYLVGGAGAVTALLLAGIRIGKASNGDVVRWKLHDKVCDGRLSEIKAILERIERKLDG